MSEIERMYQVDEETEFSQEDLLLLQMNEEQALKELGVEIEEVDHTMQQIISKTGRYGQILIDYLKENQAEKLQLLMISNRIVPIILDREKQMALLMEKIENQYIEEHKSEAIAFLDMVQLRTQAQMMAEEIAINQILLQPV